MADTFHTAPATCRAWADKAPMEDVQQIGRPCLHRFFHIVYMCIRTSSIEKVQEASSILNGLKFNVPRFPRPVSKGSQEKYTTVWTFRGIMLLRMEQAGMKSLPLGDIDLGKFVSMNPDEKGNLEKLRRAHKDTVGTVRQLVALCECKRPELLSMVCCFAGGRSMDSVDIDTLDVPAWAAKWRQLERQHGMSPHIASVCKKMRAAQVCSVQCP